MVNKKRILIIDADTDHVEILCYILREYNYTVWTSATSLFVGGNCCSQP